MEANIIDIQNNMVCLSTEFGSFWGEWKSNIPPKKEKYNLELDSDDILIFDNIKESYLPNTEIKSDGKSVVLCGFVEEITDEIMFLRLRDSLIMIQLSENEEFSMFLKKFVNVNLKNISFYDIKVY